MYMYLEEAFLFNLMIKSNCQNDVILNRTFVAVRIQVIIPVLFTVVGTGPVTCLNKGTGNQLTTVKKTYYNVNLGCFIYNGSQTFKIQNKQDFDRY